jgi:hypothetical protein
MKRNGRKRVKMVKMNKRAMELTRNGVKRVKRNGDVGEELRRNGEWGVRNGEEVERNGVGKEGWVGMGYEEEGRGEEEWERGGQEKITKTAFSPCGTFLRSRSDPLSFLPARESNLQNIFAQNFGLTCLWQCKDSKGNRRLVGVDGLHCFENVSEIN